MLMTTSQERGGFEENLKYIWEIGRTGQTKSAGIVLNEKKLT